MTSNRGFWHIVSVLSQLVSLFSKDTERQTLRDGQLEWIREQFLRTMSLLDLVWPIDKPESSNSTGIADTDRDVAVSEKATNHAEKVRNGLRLMSGS